MSTGADPFDSDADDVVSVRDRITLVNGRTFTVAHPDGSIVSGSEGTVFEDLRMLSHLVFTVCEPSGGAPFARQHLTSSTPTPFSVVAVSRRHPRAGPGHHETTEFFAHRQWVGRGVRHDFEIHNSGTGELAREVTVRLASDFAHVFEVKAGERGAVDGILVGDNGSSLHLVHPDPDRDLRVAISADPPPSDVDVDARRLVWQVRCPARGSCRVSISFEPVWHGRRIVPLFPLGERPDIEPILANGRPASHEPPLRIDSTDERLHAGVRPDVDRSRLPADLRPGRADQRGGGRWCAVVHDTVRARLDPDGMDGASVPARPGGRGAEGARQPAGHGHTTGIGGGTRQDHPRAAPGGRFGTCSRNVGGTTAPSMPHRCT